jgi:hypothetical protein
MQKASLGGWIFFIFIALALLWLVGQTGTTGFTIRDIEDRTKAMLRVDSGDCLAMAKEYVSGKNIEMVEYRVLDRQEAIEYLKQWDIEKGLEGLENDIFIGIVKVKLSLSQASAYGKTAVTLPLVCHDGTISKDSKEDIEKIME